MKALFDYLEAAKLTEEDLPQELQTQIDALDERTERWNENVDAYNEDDVEEDEEVEARLQAEEQALVQIENAIIQSVYAWLKSKSAGKSAPQPTGVPPAPQPAKTGEGDDGGGWGWLIFGSLALVVTMGAVNIFKKR